MDKWSWNCIPFQSSSLPVFSGVCVPRSLVVRVCFVNISLSFFRLAIVFCSFYGFWLPLWYLQTLLIMIPSHPVFGLTFYRSKYQFHYLLFEPARAQTNDLHTRGEHNNHYTTAEEINHMGACLCTIKYTMHIMSASI